MRTRPLGTPLDLPFFRRVIEPTAEQKALAVTYTKETATRVRDLLRELDLPVSAFDSVLRVYLQQEHMVVERAEIERENAENIERTALITKLRAKNIIGTNAVEIGDYDTVRPIPIGGVRRDPGFTPAMYDGLDSADIDELRELAKKHAIQ